MYKLEKNMVAAVQARRNWSESNTAVHTSENGTVVTLHGNIIFLRHSNGREAINLCGWNTVTTRSRLRALGVDIRTKAGQAYIGMRPCPNSGWVEL